MKKKGFTLIELLAVIVILAIIALIAVPVVMGIINTSRQKSAENSAYSYLKGLDFYIGVSELDLEPKKLESNQKYYLNKETIIDSKAIEQLNNLVEINGSRPTGLDDYVELDSNYVVKKGILTIDGYTIEIENGKVKSSVKGKKINIVDFTLNVSETSIERGSTFEIKATFKPEDTTNQKLSYKSSDESVVTVNSKGVVTGVSNGEATITVTSNDNNKISKEVKITVITSITGLSLKVINDGENKVIVGNELQLEAILEPSDTTTRALTWSSSDEKIATVDSTGKVFGKSIGEVTITATSQINENVKATIDIEVGVVVGKSFSTDSWATIVEAVKNGDASAYKVEDTKEIDMGSFGTHTIRIANTTPCDGTLESETACGFVLEFADIITTHVMNSSNTNVGGWPASEMRTYVNNDIYNALPADLRNGIVYTKVISSHNYSEQNNFESIDKLYLLSSAEIYIYGTEYDTARDSNITRQLDYYASQNSTRIKQYNGVDSAWSSRTALLNLNYRFYYVTNVGIANWSDSNEPKGVSPAFRLK